MKLIAPICLQAIAYCPRRTRSSAALSARAKRRSVCTADGLDTARLFRSAADSARRKLGRRALGSQATSTAEGRLFATRPTHLSLGHKAKHAQLAVRGADKCWPTFGALVCFGSTCSHLQINRANSSSALFLHPKLLCRTLESHAARYVHWSQNPRLCLSFDE